MSRPVISKEAQALLKLLRIALGTESCGTSGVPIESSPDGVDWKEVVRLSYEHKVSALAVDGLEASKYDPYKGLNEKETEELKSILVPWIKDMENTERSYCYYVDVLKTLCQIFKDNGLTPIILKGYGLSLNYPRPSHRGAGDIDVFLIDKNKEPAGNKGDLLIGEKFGIDVKEPDGECHSHFEFKGMTVEIHHKVSCCDYSEQQKTEALIKHCVPAESSMMFPSSTFNALYLMQHMHKHFAIESLTFRQLLDWHFFVSKYGREVDWQFVKSEWRRCKMTTFANTVIGFDVRQFRGEYSIDWIIEHNEDNEDFLINREKNRCWKTKCFILRPLYYLMNKKRWMFLYEETWMALIVRGVKRHLRIS